MKFRGLYEKDCNAKPFVKWIVQKNSKGRQLCHALPCIVTGVAAGAAKLLQSCPTLCDPIDGSPPGSPIPGVGCHFLLQCMRVKSESEVVQSCLTLRDPMDCSLPGSSVHGIFQARVLERVAFVNSQSTSF